MPQPDNSSFSYSLLGGPGDSADKDTYPTQTASDSGLPTPLPSMEHFIEKISGQMEQNGRAPLGSSGSVPTSCVDSFPPADMRKMPEYVLSTLQSPSNLGHTQDRVGYYSKSIPPQAATDSTKEHRLGSPTLPQFTNTLPASLPFDAQSSAPSQSHQSSDPVQGPVTSLSFRLESGGKTLILDARFVEPIRDSLTSFTQEAVQEYKERAAKALSEQLKAGPTTMETRKIPKMIDRLVGSDFEDKLYYEKKKQTINGRPVFCLALTEVTKTPSDIRDTYQIELNVDTLTLNQRAFSSRHQLDDTVLGQTRLEGTLGCHVTSAVRKKLKHHIFRTYTENREKLCDALGKEAAKYEVVISVSPDGNDIEGKLMAKVSDGGAQLRQEKVKSLLIFGN